MAFPHQTNPRSTFKILGDALKLSTKNPTLVLTVLTLSFLSSSIIFLFNILLLTPLTSDITTKAMAIASLDPSTITPEDIASFQASILKYLKEILGLEVIVLTASFIVYSLISFATIHVFSLAYTGESLTPKELLCRVVRKLKGPTITRLYICLFNLVYFFLLGILLGFIGLLYSLSSSVLSIVIGVMLAIFGLVVYLFLSMVWPVSVVVSVVEDCYGLNAISKAGEAIKGRRWQGVRLVLIMSSIGGVIYRIYSFGFSGANNSSPPTSGFTLTKLGFGLAFTLASAMLGLFQWAVFMVFYCDCKESKGEFEQIQAMDGGFFYASLPKVDAQDV